MSGDILGRRVNSAANTQLVMEWFERCCSTHQRCGSAPVGEKPSLPTRIVDVSRIGEGGEPFLLETQDLLCGKYKYIALSHRWGGARITTTTKDNLLAHKAAVPWAGLCRTFQDAMIVTNRLGFQFLWIDSLCIIQDCAEDWRREASRMASIYKYAAITIAAACATSGDTGLFQPRKSSLEVEIPYYTKDGIRDGHYFASDREVKSFRDEVVNGPLNTRAWTLQERHLSRRILHYGRTQLLWECQSTVWEESSEIEHNAYDRFGGDLKDGYLTSLSSLLWRNLDPLAERHEVIATPFSTWYWLVSQYSRRLLTFGDDKLPAISGLAREFASCREDLYVAGLWRGDLPVGLLWHSDSGGLLNRANPLRAPSWSWAAWDGPISFESDWDGALDVENVHVAVDLLDSDPFGRTGSGTIRVSGLLRPIRAAPPDNLANGRGWHSTNASLLNDDGVCVGCGCVDEPHMNLNKSLYALSIFRVFIGWRPFSPEVLEARGHWTWCLLLKSYGIATTFERVGLAQVDQDFFDAISNRKDVFII